MENGEDDLYCCSCKCLNVDPLILSCLHSVCRQCVERELKEESVQCPTCSASSSTWVANTRLKRAAQQEKLILKLEGKYGSVTKCESCIRHYEAVCYCTDCEHFLCKECRVAHQRLKVTRSHSSVLLTKTRHMHRAKLIKLCPSSKVALCPYHDMKLDKHCRKCDVLVCESCVSSIHDGHDVGHWSRKGEESREVISQTVEHLKATLKKNKPLSERSSKELCRNRKKEAVKEITETFKKIRSAIDKREQTLLTQCDQLEADATAQSEKNFKIRENCLKSLQENLKFAQETLDFEDDELIELSDIISERCKELEQELGKTSSEVAIGQISLDFNLSYLLDIIPKWGSINVRGVPETKSSSGLSSANATATTSQSLVDGGPSSSSTAVVLKTNNNQVLGAQRLSIFKSFDDSYRSDTKVTVSSPRAVAFDEQGDIFVTSSRNLIYIIGGCCIGGDKNGSIKLLSPAGIAVEKGMIYVTEEEGNRVQMLTTSGKFIGFYGGKDSNEFSKPRDIKISPDDKVYIADTGNCRVSVYNKDWTISHRIYCPTRESSASKSSSSSSIDSSPPHGLSFDGSCNVHIVWRGRRPASVTVHDNKGAFIREYGRVHLNRGVAGIAIDSHNNSYVINDNIGFTVYTQGGEKHSDILKFNCPEGLAIAPNGQMWVADTNNHRIATVEYEVRFK